jgi:hypothetical protein
MSDEGSKVIRSVHPAPLATIRTLAKDFVSFAAAQHRNEIISVNGITVSALVKRHLFHKRNSKFFSIVVDIGTGVG